MFVSRATIANICLAIARISAHAPDEQAILKDTHTINGDQKDWLSPEIRSHWMRRANQALHDLVSPCPHEAFGTVIVNHTRADDIGDLICIGANGNLQTGNPALHGEIAGINNCTAVLADPNGRWKLSPSEILQAWHSLTLYTNAEPCPMCSSAIRWAGFKECVFGTSTQTLIKNGWSQIQETSEELFARTGPLKPHTTLIQHVLPNETDPYFAWQYNPDGKCPTGCSRGATHTGCVPTL